MNKLRLNIFVILMLFGFLNECYALAYQDESTDILSSQQALPVDDRIKDLVKKSQANVEGIEVIYLRLRQQESNFNLAEKYLMTIVEGYLDKKAQRFEEGIEKLKQAISYEEKLNKEQLSTTEFSQIHLLLASLYAQTGDYKAVYDEKKRYFDKFIEYRKTVRDERLDNLNAKYDTDIKLKENELLESQQKLKTLQIAEASEAKKSQNRNIVLLVVTALIFFILLIRQLKIRAKLRYLAKTDSLTGLFNRRTLFKRGELLLQEAKSKNLPLSVMMLDIDHFKQINDSFGHDVGDQAIVQVAILGKETLRSKDIFARIGGEEYAVILPNTEIKEAKAVAERLREKVQNISLAIKSNEPVNVKATISIGVAQLKSDITDFDELLHLADEAMYQAKNKGRNQVCY